jgi:hypothetical protein
VALPAPLGLHWSWPQQSLLSAHSRSWTAQHDVWTRPPICPQVRPPQQSSAHPHFACGAKHAPAGLRHDAGLGGGPASTVTPPSGSFAGLVIAEPCSVGVSPASRGPPTGPSFFPFLSGRLAGGHPGEPSSQTAAPFTAGTVQAVTAAAAKIQGSDARGMSGWVMHRRCRWAAPAIDARPFVNHPPRRRCPMTSAGPAIQIVRAPKW